MLSAVRRCSETVFGDRMEISANPTITLWTTLDRTPVENSCRGALERLGFRVYPWKCLVLIFVYLENRLCESRENVHIPISRPADSEYENGIFRF